MQEYDKKIINSQKDSVKNRTIFHSVHFKYQKDGYIFFNQNNL